MCDDLDTTRAGAKEPGRLPTSHTADTDGLQVPYHVLERKMTSAVAMFAEAVRWTQQTGGQPAAMAMRARLMRRWIAAAAERGLQAEDNSLRAYCAGLEEACQGSHQWEKLEESATKQAYRFTRCLWADAFRSLRAEDIGIWICEADGPVAAAFNPSIKFQRTKTIMEGDDFCDHVYFVDEPS
jgi:hypothetical protein